MVRLMKDSAARVLPPALLVLISLFSAFICFSKPGYYILGGDLYYPLDPSIDVYRLPFTWDARYATGGTGEARHIPSFVFSLFFFFLNKLSVPLAVSQKIAIFGIFSLTAPAMYYLMLVIVRDLRGEVKPKDRLAAFIAGFFYNFNLWNLFNLASPSVHLELSYLAAPLVLAFFLKGLRGSAPLYLSLIAVLYAAISPAASNPIYTLNTIWPVGFFVAFLLIRYVSAHDKTALYRTVIFSLFALAVFILVNLWWLLPMYDTLKASVSTIEKSGSIWGWLDWKSTRTSFFNIFKLTNHEAWNHSKLGDLIIASANVYETNPVFILINFLFLSVAFLSLMSRKRNFYTFCFAAMMVVMVFMAKGAHDPIGFVNKFLHQKILVLTLYRSVEWYTPMIVLSYAYLLGEGSVIAYGLMKRYGETAGRSFLSVFFACLILVNYPFWTGKVVHQGQKTGEIANPYFVKVPPWYFKAARWINSQPEDFRVVSAPSLAPYYHTDWGFSGGELGVFLFNKPTINNIYGWDSVRDISAIIIDSINGRIKDQGFRLDRVLAILNIKYIALRNDVADWIEDRMIKIDTGPAASRLSSQEGISLDKTIGGMEFYKNDSFLPHIYAASTPVFVASPNVDAMVPMSHTGFLERNPALLFTGQLNPTGLAMLSVNGSSLNTEAVEGQAGVAKEDENLVLFANYGIEELTLDMAEAEVRYADRLSRSSSPLFFSLYEEGGRFKVAAADLYSIFVKLPEDFVKLSRYINVEVDGQLVKAGIQAEKFGKWAAVVSIKLDPGRHRISFSTRLDMDDKQFLSERLARTKILIVPGSRLDEYRRAIERVKASYLFYADQDDPVVRKNGFAVNGKKFYVSREGVYDVKARLLPKSYITEADSVTGLYSTIKAQPEAVSGWEVIDNNITYEKSVNNDGLTVDVLFSARGSIDQGITISKKFDGIDIKQKPYLVAACDISKRDAQGVTLDLKFMHPESLFFRTKTISVKMRDNILIVDLFKTAMDTFGIMPSDELLLKEVNIHFNKGKSLDASMKMEQRYRFVLRNLAFLETAPVMFSLEDRLPLKFTPEVYYYLENGDLRDSEFLEDIPPWITDIFMMRINRSIDLAESPILNFHLYPPGNKSLKSAIGFLGRFDFPVSWKIVMGLSFSEDGKEEAKVETSVKPVAGGSMNMIIQVKAFEEARKAFPGRKIYHLTSIGIRRPDGKVLFSQSAETNRLVRYKRRLHYFSDSFASGIILLDGKPLGEAKVARDGGAYQIGYSGVRLGKGRHVLEVLKDEKLKADMIEITPVEYAASGQMEAAGSLPKISFRRLDPTRYVADVKGATGPFTLIFSESFHDGWKAYTRRGLATKDEPVTALLGAFADRGNREELKDHFSVNGYANGWGVPAGAGRDFQVIIEYRSQRLLEAGALISGLTLLCSISYLGLSGLRWVGRGRKHERRNGSGKGGVDD